MIRLSKQNVEDIITLRKKGKTYSEIKCALNISISKSTISYYCRKVNLSFSQKKRIKKIVLQKLSESRKLALITNSNNRSIFLKYLADNNSPISDTIENREVAKIALSMLCLGEASKYGKSAFALGNTNPQIIIIFLQLLKKQVGFDPLKIRCTVQCRADQDIDSLEIYWSEITSIPRSYFYKAQIDPRTIGKPTKINNYKGVLRINYADAKMQQDLESLSSHIYNKLLKLGPVV